MTHNEQRKWLITYLLQEDERYAQYQIPEGEKEQKDLLRALMNVRMPSPVSDEFLTIQDEYLTAENEAKGIVNVNDLKPSRVDKRIYLWQGDMSRLNADAVVNPANSALLGCFSPLHSCLDNSIRI